MTKQNIINEVAVALDIKAKEAKPIVEAIFEMLITSIENGINVEISGFGKFIIRQKPKRIGRNPMTDEEAEMCDIFSPKAKELWEAIPMIHRTRLLNNVWCGNCTKMTTIVHYSGQLKGDALLLEGECERCGKTVARLIESS